jgi:hypothetical protein
MVNWKGCGEEVAGAHFKGLSQHLPLGTRKTVKSCHNRYQPNGDSNRGLSEKEGVVIIIM